MMVKTEGLVIRNNHVNTKALAVINKVEVLNSPKSKVKVTG